ncbi:hypothetical protein [Nibricoccus sp. IMCC34717]|uniref:hypothetical protein n=1 Tax=Nibricoccus sp. IMCC34717 TaxID=3034021 RepID=UPI00384C0820
MKTSTRFLGCQQRVLLASGESTWRWNLPRLAITSAVVLVSGYFAVTAGGYFWLRYARNAETVSYTSVLLLRTDDVRASIGESHLKEARATKARREYQQAYVSYVSALRSNGRDPALRLEVADFLVSVGAVKQAISVLEQGLPDKTGKGELGLRLLELLNSQGLDQRIRDLLKTQLAQEFSGKQAQRFRAFEIDAALAVEGPVVAERLLDAHPEVLQAPGGNALAARVRWDSGKRDTAIRLLSDSVAANRATLGEFSMLSEFQEQLGHAIDVQETGRAAVRRFGMEPQARLLLIASLRGVGMAGSENWRSEIEKYLRDFSKRPEALISVAELGGRRGWVDFTRTLYSGSLRSGRLTGMFGLCLADSLLRVGRVSDARRVLDELASQIGDEPSFAVYLRRRQILAAAAAGATLAVREHARGLALLLASDPAALEATRRQFARAGLTEAAAELGGPKPVRSVPAQGTRIQ